MAYRQNEERFTPKPLNRSYNLCGCEFRLFSLKGFDFDRGLDVPKKDGLYCFTKMCPQQTFEYQIDNIELTIKITPHIPLYLGKADGINGLYGRQNSVHEKYDELNGKATHVAFYECGYNEDAEEIESLILSKYFFTLNKKENEIRGNRYPIVLEVSVDIPSWR